MIVDAWRRWGQYLPRLDSARDFLLALVPETPEGEYPILGNDVFARVMSYETKEREALQLEAHREYVDIQAVISGAEGIEWIPTADLGVKAPYDSSKDVEFYQPPRSGLARVDVVPGIFVVLFPWDAHMPQLRVPGSSPAVKKVVVKVRASLVTGEAAVAR